MSAADHKREFAFSDDDFRFLADMVMNKTGIFLSDIKKDMVYGRVARRLRALGLKKVSDYCNLLASEESDTEMMDFVNAVTTNLTKFFRENHHFEHLKEEVFRPMITNPPPGKRVRIWSAGCSSGMEPYSIAMTAYDSIPNIESWDFKILATDIDTNMLGKGSSGIYNETEIEGIPESYRKRFLVRKGNPDEYQVIDNLRNLISFKRLNFLDDWPVKGPFDVIFCRNVVIYFTKDTQKIIFNKFADVMKPDGWLCIGHSENLMKVTDRFKLMGRTIYRKIK